LLGLEAKTFLKNIDSMVNSIPSPASDRGLLKEHLSGIPMLFGTPVFECLFMSKQNAYDEIIDEI
jgi:hypothetical protein